MSRSRPPAGPTIRPAAVPRRSVLLRRAGALAAAGIVLASVPAAAAPGRFVPLPEKKAKEQRADATAATAARLENLRGDEAGLRRFLEGLPKGGDLHNHLSGAVPTEALVALAAQRGLCIETATHKAVEAPCGEGTRPAQDAVDDAEFRRETIAAWSMEEYQNSAGATERKLDESGHDHFFATFGKFSAVTHEHRGELLAEVAKVAAGENQRYLETMFFPAGSAIGDVISHARWNDDLQAMRRQLLADPAMGTFVRQARENTDGELDEYRAALGCGTSKAHRACATRLRFLVQVGRAAEPTTVFARLLAGFELAKRDGRFVGVNLAQAEDSPLALRDYRLQMRMVGALRKQYPDVHVALHAGELTPDLVKPEDLRFHIDDAVRTAGAERIGHGVDLVHEDDHRRLLKRMAARHVALESPLTSNCQILGVCGAEHPIRRYLDARVPVVLSTDDPGVSRIDLTHEYVRAAVEHGFTYRELRTSTRASLEHSFLPGASLWRARDDYRPARACAGSMFNGGAPSAGCRELLASSPKAQAQWDHEVALAGFEERTARS